jgi:hypothetical protein
VQKSSVAHNVENPPWLWRFVTSAVWPQAHWMKKRVGTSRSAIGVVMTLTPPRLYPVEAGGHLKRPLAGLRTGSGVWGVCQQTGSHPGSYPFPPRFPPRFLGVSMGINSVPITVLRLAFRHPIPSSQPAICVRMAVQSPSNRSFWRSTVAPLPRLAPLYCSRPPPASSRIRPGHRSDRARGTMLDSDGV